MRRSNRFIKTLILVVSSIWSISAFSRQARTPVYFFTKPSEHYFSDGEMDTLFYRITDTIFKEAGIPKSLFERKYPQLKLLIVTSSKKEIARSFQRADLSFGAVLPPKGSERFRENKSFYIAKLSSSIRQAFYSNGTLSQYLQFKGSDRILFFNSTVHILPDGRLDVVEKIRIYNGDGAINPVYGNDAELTGSGGINNEIQRGIVRAFPLYYINRAKLFQNTTFKVLEVWKNGEKENFHTEKKDNGILLFTGSKDVFLKNGIYEYTIRYETDHQLKFLKDFDELYWNATGNSWSFRIDSARCTIIVPQGASVLSNSCYTGSQGEAAKNCDLLQSGSSDSTWIVFKTTRPLLPNTGMTVATSWQKGFVKEKSILSKAGYYIWNNKGVFFFPLAALFSALFCFFYWFRYGRDPEKGTIYPQYEPPAGYSPAALGYIYHQEFKRQFTAATIVDAAVRQTIKIEVEKAGILFKHNKYTIKPGDKKSKPPMTHYDDYYNDVKYLMGTSIDKGKYNSKLADLNKTVQKDCETKFKNKDGAFKQSYKGLFALNAKYTVLPVIVCIVAAIWGFFEGVIKALTLLNFWQIAYWVAGLILCIVVLRYFSRILRAYSPEGRKLMDRIEGFRMFLATADEKRFDMLAPPERSLELYEKYLPFAIALGCEIQWGEKFEDIINSAYLDGTVVASSFAYSMRQDSSNFSSSFASSFSGAIASASTPPSSSSGGGSSFGGGSSGGGGGGGGGGGW